MSSEAWQAERNLWADIRQNRRAYVKLTGDLMNLHNTTFQKGAWDVIAESIVLVAQEVLDDENN